MLDHILVQSNFIQRSCFMVKPVYSLFLVHTCIYSIDRARCLVKLNQFVEATESVSTFGNKSKGEDMDACLEEVSKDSKVWQHGSMAAWQHGCSSLAPNFQKSGKFVQDCFTFFTYMYRYQVKKDAIFA